MQSLSNPFIHINPFKSTIYNNLKKTTTKLKIPLLKFPGIIGHSTSRVNRLYNDDTFSMNMLRGIYGPNSTEPVLNLSLFDGHGFDGKACSNLLASKLHLQLVEDINPTKESFFQLLQRYATEVGGGILE